MATKASGKQSSSESGGKKVYQPPKCPITKEQFEAKAPASLMIDIGGRQDVAVRKVFKSGSFGYYVQTRFVLVIDGVPTKFVGGLNITAVGSGPNAKAVPSDNGDDVE